MKKTPFLFSLVLVCTILLSSCIGLGLLFGVFDESKYWGSVRTYKQNLSELPAYASAIVLFDNAEAAVIIIKKWNDTEINEALYGRRGIDENDRAEITVPSGDNSFLFDLFFNFWGITFNYRNLELQYNFAAGTKYIVKPRYTTIGSGNSRKYEFFFGIYSDVKNSEPLKEWKLGESR